MDCTGGVPVKGSSPRMRGAPHQGRFRGDLEGIIPAYAGSTTASRCFLAWARDHPRVCGEHVPDLTLKCCLKGSSPRMRGAQERDAPNAQAQGIIPAYAGSTKVLEDNCADC